MSRYTRCPRCRCFAKFCVCEPKFNGGPKDAERIKKEMRVERREMIRESNPHKEL